MPARPADQARRTTVFRTSTRTASGLLAGLLVAAAATISGCAAGQVSQTADQVSSVDGGVGNVGPIGIRNALLATPAAGSYSKGADVPVLLWLTNTGMAADTLSSVSTTAASSVSIGGTATLPPQSRVEVGASTPVTVTIKGLTDGLSFGTSIPVTFAFATAGDVTINIPVEIPAERTNTDRPTVDIHPQEVPNLWQSGEQAASGTPGAPSSSAPAPSTTSAAPASSATGSSTGSG
jgi:copper(I)-binding protein